MFYPSERQYELVSKQINALFCSESKIYKSIHLIFILVQLFTSKFMMQIFQKN
jgi:hypothetical protein